MSFALARNMARALCVVGLPILGTNFVLMQSTNVAVLYMGAALFAIGNGIMWPSIVSMVSKVAADRFQGAIQVRIVHAGAQASADPAGERALAATEVGDELYSPTSFL
jgi:threonine/homoserine efflux transporter RhtA